MDSMDHEWSRTAGSAGSGFDFVSWGRKNGFHFFSALNSEWDDAREIPEDILRLDPPGDYIRFYEEYDGGECPLDFLFGGRGHSLVLYPLCMHREKSRQLLDDVIRLQIKWENWYPGLEEQVKEALDEALIIGEASFRGNIVFLRGKFFLARHMELIGAFGIPSNTENILACGDADGSFYGILRKAVGMDPEQGECI